MNILNLRQLKPHQKPWKNSMLPALSTQKPFDDYLDKLEQDGKLSQHLRKKLKSIRATISKFYGICKTYKKDCPLQPVLSMTKSSYFDVAKKVTRWLSVI